MQTKKGDYLRMKYELTRMKKFETVEECESRNALIIKSFEKESKLFKLSQKINNCTSDNPCQSIFCAKCKREYRLKIVPPICRFIAKERSKGNLIYAVTLLEDCNDTNTIVVDIAKFKNTLFQRLKRNLPNNAVVIGGFDIQLNTDSDYQWAPFFHPHWHLVFIGMTKEQIKEALSRFYPKTLIIKKPIRCREINSILRAVSCTISPYFAKRVRYWVANPENRKPYYSAKEVKLEAKELQKLGLKLKNNLMTDIISI